MMQEIAVNRKKETLQGQPVKILPPVAPQSLQRPEVEQQQDEWKSDKHGFRHQAEHEKKQCEPEVLP